MNLGSARLCVLTINGGSSSICFALFDIGGSHPSQPGRIGRIGLPGTNLAVAPAEGEPATPRSVPGPDHRAAVEFLLSWLEGQPFFPSFRAVGLRVVHGMNHSAPEPITLALLAELRRITPFDPEHLPWELHLIMAFRRRYPKLPQVACFNTAFHRTMPRVAKLLPIPRRYAEQGLVRYGFHGLSHAYLLEEPARIGDPSAKKGRVILAHLGNGASLAALRDGKSIDTSMGFTPAAGMVMGTRSGDLDPGILSYLSRRERITPAQFDRMVNRESGLLVISGTSSDMRDLCARKGMDARADVGAALLCYQAKKWIGAYAAALGGLDTLVFAGGIGENTPPIGARICAGLGFLGVDGDKKTKCAERPGDLLGHRPRRRAGDPRRRRTHGFKVRRARPETRCFAGKPIMTTTAPTPPTAWYAPARLWQRKSAIIAGLAITGIATHLALRFAFNAGPPAYRLPLLATLVVGGLPMLCELLRKLQKRNFGSDLLGGISIVTSVLLGEYLAGSIIVLMLAGGEALESYALRSASSVLAAPEKRVPLIAHRKREADIADVALAEVAVGDILVIYPHEICPVDGVNALRAAFPPKVVSDLDA